MKAEDIKNEMTVSRRAFRDASTDCSISPTREGEWIVDIAVVDGRGRTVRLWSSAATPAEADKLAVDFAAWAKAPPSGGIIAPGGPGGRPGGGP